MPNITTLRMAGLSKRCDKNEGCPSNRTCSFHFHCATAMLHLDPHMRMRSHRAAADKRRRPPQRRVTEPALTRRVPKAPGIVSYSPRRCTGCAQVSTSRPGNLAIAVSMLASNWSCCAASLGALCAHRSSGGERMGTLTALSWVSVWDVGRQWAAGRAPPGRLECRSGVAAWDAARSRFCSICGRS